MPSRKAEKTKKTGAKSGPADNGGNELKPRATVVERIGDDEISPPRDLNGAVDELLVDPEPTSASSHVVEVDALPVASLEVEDAEGSVAPAADSGEGARGVTTADVLENVVRSQRASKLRLGDILKEMGLVTEQQVEAALERQKDTHKRLGQLLIDDGILSELDLAKALAAKFGVSFLDLSETTFDAAATSYIDEKLARRYGAAEAPIIKLVNSIIAQSVDDAASDIHFEPQAKELMIRFRIDGVLHEIMSIPRRMQAGVISRLKIMAELDIAERRVPQDGRIGLMVGGKPIDMRVATLPTVYGEKIVMRLLDKSNVMLDLEDLGFAEKALKRFQRSFSRPYGALLVTAPTGSGQSTTLYAALNILNLS